jgi:hypothetical protein
MSEPVKAGRPRGTFTKNSIGERVLELEPGGVVLVPDDATNVRQSCLRAVARVNQVLPEAVYTVVLCSGAPVRNTEGDEFDFFRIRREV